MNAFDLLVLILLALGLVAGARAGFLGPVLGLLGAVAGFVLAVTLASVLRESLLVLEQPTRALVTLLGLAAFVVSGEALGAGIGAMMSRSIRHSPLRPVDMAGGAVVGVAHVVVLVWLIGGLMTMGLAPILGSAARESVAIRETSERLPPPDAVAGRIMELLATTEIPGLFAGLEPTPAAPVDLPGDPQVRALADSAIPSTARVSSAGCGAGLSVGSGFFVAPEHAVTNSHVVAGSTTTSVTLNGVAFDAVVVAFDPNADLALLHVPGAGAPTLELATGVPDRGTPAAALGYPGGGELTVTPSAVAAAFDITGPNIYGNGAHRHSVVELRGQIRRGNSGGPLVTRPGVVGAVVFGSSQTSAEVGYAIGADQARQTIGPFIGSTQPVGTGDCL